MRKNNRQKGQSLLIVLLITVTALTIILALISRSIMDIRLSSQTEQSKRAFSAAEAGIEEALRRGLAAPGFNFYVGDISVKVESKAVGEIVSGDSYIFPKKTPKNDIQTVWLVPHDSGGNINDSAVYYSGNTLKICWGETTTIDDNTPAVEAILIYKESPVSSYKMAKNAYDPNDSRRGGNNFSEVINKSGGYCNSNKSFLKEINFSSEFGVDPTPPASNILVMLRVKPFYSETGIVVSPQGSSLPSQGFEKVSTAVASENITSRRKVFQSYPALPSIFDYAIFSGGSLTK